MKSLNSINNRLIQNIILTGKKLQVLKFTYVLVLFWKRNLNFNMI